MNLALAFCIISVICAIGMCIVIYLCHSQYRTYIALKKEVDHLSDEQNTLTKTLDINKTELERTDAQIEKARMETELLLQRKEELNQDIEDNMRQVEHLKESFETTEEQFRRNYMTERRDWLDERTSEYVQMQADFVEQFKEENHKKLEAARQLEETLTTLREKVSAATALAKQQAADENYEQFHCLQLSEQDIQEINKIETAIVGVSPLAANAVHKVIWKVYYEKPYTDLIGRVCGSDIKTGIYKITNTENKMCYVGQAVNIAERWKQHIKRAVGAEERTNNKLYPAMDRVGPWHFTFEIIEEVPREKLSEREDYWQDFYQAKEYGYSIK